MEINPIVVQQLLDKAEILYKKDKVQNGVSFRILDSNGKTPLDFSTVTVYDTGTVVIFPKLSLREFFNLLR